MGIDFPAMLQTGAWFATKEQRRANLLAVLYQELTPSPDQLCQNGRKMTKVTLRQFRTRLAAHPLSPKSLPAVSR